MATNMKLTEKQRLLLVKMASWIMKESTVFSTEEGNKAVGMLAKIVSNGQYSSLEKEFLNQLRERYVKHIKKETKF